MVRIMDDRAHREREHFFGAAKVIMALTLGSRILGMIRDIAIASLGATRATSAFVVAFQIPNLFRRLFGEGALSAAFVPVFTETSEQEGPGGARRVLANALGLLAALLAGLMLLGYAVLLVWHVAAPGAWDRRLLLGLTAVMLPFMVTICLLALGSAALNCRGHFAFPAFAPILLNLFIIAAAWGAAPLWSGRVTGQLYVIAGSVAVAGGVQLAAVLWLLRRAGLTAAFRPRPVQPEIRTMLRLMGPMILGLGFLQIAELLQTVLAWLFAATPESPALHVGAWRVAKPLDEGALMRIYAARRLYQMPLGLLAMSLGVAVFPLLSRYAARGERGSLRDALCRALRLTTVEGVGAGVGLLVLARPIMRAIFAWRRFTVADADAAAFILQMYAVGMWSYCTLTILLRAFYALKDTVTPLIVSCGMMLANLALVLALLWRLEAGSFGLATALSATGNAAILTWLLRRRLDGLDLRPLAASFARSAVAAGAMAGVLLGLLELSGRYGEALIGNARLLTFLVVGCGVLLGTGTYLLTLRLLRAPELAELRGVLTKRASQSE